MVSKTVVYMKSVSARVVSSVSAHVLSIVLELAEQDLVLDVEVIYSCFYVLLDS